MTQWERSVVTDVHLSALVARGLLPPRTVAMEWRAPGRERSPVLRRGYVVSFLAFHMRGFAMHAHRFLREVLHHYGVALHELAPNGVQQMAAFTALCEGYLGIDHHFELFTYFFKAALVKTKAGVAPWGLCSIRMKQSRVAQYPRVKLSRSN